MHIKGWNKKHGLPNSTIKLKNAEKLLTVNDILTKDDVKEVLSKVANDQTEITDLVCIYQDKEGYINWHTTNDTTLDRKILMMEQVKIWLLQGDNND